MTYGKKIFLNLSSTILGFIWMISSFIVGLSFILSVSPTREFYAVLVLIYLTIFGSLFVASIITMPKWFAYVRVHGDNLQYVQAFRKKLELPLDTYKFIYRCVKSSSGFRAQERGPAFIVLAQGPMTHYEVTHVDHLQGSVELVVIKYTKRHINAVFNLCSNPQKDVLVRVFSDYVKDIKRKVQ